VERKEGRKGCEGRNEGRKGCIGGKEERDKEERDIKEGRKKGRKKGWEEGRDGKEGRGGNE
jgi:hypothetical protein